MYDSLVIQLKPAIIATLPAYVTEFIKERQAKKKSTPEFVDVHCLNKQPVKQLE